MKYKLIVRVESLESECIFDSKKEMELVIQYTMDVIIKRLNKGDIESIADYLTYIFGNFILSLTNNKKDIEMFIYILNLVALSNLLGTPNRIEEYNLTIDIEKI